MNNKSLALGNAGESGELGGVSAPQTLMVLMLGLVALLATAAALNGGTALTASVWDGLKTTLTGMLSSSWVLALAFIVLIIAVWQLAHGRGYGSVGLILGLLSVALIGPSFVTSISTATRVPQAQVKEQVQAYSVQPLTSPSARH